MAATNMTRLFQSPQYGPLGADFYLAILTNAATLSSFVSQDPPQHPQCGDIYLFDERILKKWKDTSYSWSNNNNLSANTRHANGLLTYSNHCQEKKLVRWASRLPSSSNLSHFVVVHYHGTAILDSFGIVQLIQHDNYSACNSNESSSSVDDIMSTDAFVYGETWTDDSLHM